MRSRNLVSAVFYLLVALSLHRKSGIRPRGGRGVQGRRTRCPSGAKPWTACPPRGTSTRRGRAAETTDVRGRFDDEHHRKNERSGERRVTSDRHEALNLSLVTHHSSLF